MNSKQSSFPFCVLAALAASAATTACGRSPAPEIASTSVTSAVATPPADREEDPVCTAPESASTPPPSAPIAKPAKHVANRSALVETSAVRPPDNDAKRALDKAIAESVAGAHEAERQDATPVSARPEVTTTSATVPRAATTPSAPVRVAFDNRLPSVYRLQRFQLLVDGRVAYDGRSAGSVRLEPGDHVVEVIVDYRVDDSIFASAGDHGIELRSTEVIPTSPAPAVFVATATPTGGVTTSIDQRASLSWRSFQEGRTEP
jgi:hypothetical protein